MTDALSSGIWPGGARRMYTAQVPERSLEAAKVAVRQGSLCRKTRQFTQAQWDALDPGVQGSNARTLRSASPVRTCPSPRSRESPAWYGHQRFPATLGTNLRDSDSTLRFPVPQGPERPI